MIFFPGLVQYGLLDEVGDNTIMANKARLAFIGLGTMGRDLLRETVKNPKADVVALCDIDPEALAKAKEVIDAPTCADCRQVLDPSTLDGVVIAVPQHLHASLTIDALDAGIPTFCEKPMGLNVAECRAMIAASKRSGKGLMIGQVLRYIGVYRYLRELALSGEFGDAFAVRIIRTMWLWGSWARPWRYRRDLSGGPLLEINAHEIDFMLGVLGPAAWAAAVGKRYINPENDFEDFINAQITFRNGGIGVLTSGFSDYLGRYSGEVFLSKGTFYFDSVTQTVHLKKDGQEKQVWTYADIHPEWENGVYREMREFVEACLGETSVTIPGEDGLRAVEVAEACYRSIETGKPVALPLE